MELQKLKPDATRQVLFKPLKTQISLYSRVLFNWIHPVLFNTAKLENKNIFSLPESEMVENEKLSELLKLFPLFRALISANLSTILLSLALNFITGLLDLANPIFIKFLLEYLESDEKPLDYGLFLAILFTICSIFNTFLKAQRNFFNEILQIRVRNSLYNVIYTKTLKCRNLPEEAGVNLLQVDVQTIAIFFNFFASLIIIPLHIGVGTYLAYQQVGYAIFGAILTVIAIMIMNLAFSKTCKRSNEQLNKIRDQRIEESTQMLTEIKMIKAYNWQSYFAAKIQEIRKKELGMLRYLNILNSLNEFSFWILPHLNLIVVLLVYIYVMGESINSEKIFVTMNAIFFITYPLLRIPNVITHVIKLITSKKRIQNLIDEEPWVQLVNSNKIQLKNCVFAYGEKVVLKNITLDVMQKEFLAVVGPVGCGKSSLLLSLIGETTLVSGDFLADTDISYAPSLESWIINDTLRENILMGRKYNPDWYYKVIDACCLVDDFNSFPASDNTEIGERGINLSGGQKARICLARAVYADKKIILMDDPLSSVDNDVAERIFSKCFMELLKDKTRILVTHRHKFLNQVDRVVHMNNGIIEKISIQEIGDEKEIEEEKTEKLNEKKNDNLMQEEDRKIGEVDIENYEKYIEWGGGYELIIIVILCTCIWLVCEILGVISMKDWSDHQDQSDKYLLRLIIYRLVGNISVLVRLFVLKIVISIKASSASHKDLLASLVSAPINLFYDITPLGRILNRLSKDLNVIDTEVAGSWAHCIACISICLSGILMGIIYFPSLMIVLIFIVIFPTKWISKFYLIASRELTRLESISSSPIVSHFKQTIIGVKHIRVLNQTSNFIEKNYENINTSTRVNYSLVGCRIWMALYLEIFSLSLVICFFFMAVTIYNDISSGVAGFACLS